MKRGNKLLDGPGTPSLMSVQELRLMALLRDLVGDVGQGEAADVLGIDRKTVWRSLGAGRLTPRLADALERLLLAGGGSAAARQREQVDALERRIDGLKNEMRRALAAVEGGVEALREERAEEMRGVRRRLAQVETRQGAQGVEEATGPVRQPPVRGGVPAEVPRAGDPRACRRRRGGVRSGVAADSRVAGAEGQPPQPGQGAVVAHCGGAAHGGGGGASGGARADAAPRDAAAAGP